MASYRIEATIDLKGDETIWEANRMILDDSIDHSIELIKKWVKQNLIESFVEERGLRIYNVNTNEIVYKF